MQDRQPFIRNVAIDIRLDEGALVISSFSTQRGFLAIELAPGQPGYAVALAVMEGGALDVDALSPADRGALWFAGLLILPIEQGAIFAPSTFDVRPEPFREQGFMVVPACVTAEMTSTLATHYRKQVAAGVAQLQVNGPDRHFIHNDPAGRVVQRALLPAVQNLVGKPLRPSYSYASLYRVGASMKMHRDRPQCAYTLSLAIDHHPTPTDGVSPWPLCVEPGAEAPVAECLLPLGGGLLFRGHELRHGRNPLAEGQTCWTLLLHYVDADFDGTLH